MDILTFIQKYFVFLLPGIIGILLYHKLNIHKEQHYYLEFVKVITYSIFSFVFADAVFWIIKKLFPCFIYSPINIIHYLTSNVTSIPTANVVLAMIFALVFACVYNDKPYVVVYDSGDTLIAQRLSDDLETIFADEQIRISAQDRKLTKVRFDNLEIDDNY